MRPYVACANGNVGRYQSNLRRRYQVSNGVGVHSALLRQTSERVRKRQSEDLHGHRIPQRLQHHRRQGI